MILGGLVFLGLIVNLGNGDERRSQTTRQPETSYTRSAPPSQVAATTRAPAGPVTSFRDGMYEVGRDIAPGTYAAPGGSNCYWARHKDASGESLITNEWSPGQGQVIVEARAGEYLEVSDCGTWQKR